MTGIATAFFVFTGVFLTALAVASANPVLGIFGSILGVCNVLVGCVGAYRSQ